GRPPRCRRGRRDRSRRNGLRRRSFEEEVYRGRTKKFPGGRSRPGGEEGGTTGRRRNYDARAAGRLGAATTAGTALTVLVIFVRDAVRAMLRALTTKHFSSAWSTRSSTASAFSRITSEISEMISALARSSIRFSRNDRLFDLLRKVRLLSTSAMS